MKITLICGHYLPKLGYLEVHLARALADLCHEVSVVTTSAVPRYVGHLQSSLQSGLAMDGKVKVLRLAPQFELGQVVISKGLKAAIRAEKPDLLIAIGLGKRFPKPVFGLGIAVVSLFGDNLHSYAGTTFAERLKTKLQFALLKASTYKAAIDGSAALVAYTPESFEAAARMLGGSYAEKLRAQDNFISLGFDPALFFFDPALRQKIRTEYGLDAAVRVLITSTRVVPEKALEDALTSIAQLPEHWHWWVVGGDGSVYTRNFETKALAALGPSRFRMFPYQDRQDLNKLFNAADTALYTVPAISVFEVLGTGLPCILPPAASLGHVHSKADLATPWRAGHDIALNPAVAKFDLDDASRRERALESAAHYSWNALAGRLLQMIKA
jgi:glycosyltransferase involved in cell wall biosynthesis